VDEVVKPQQFNAHVQARALEFATQSDRPSNATGVSLQPLTCRIDAGGYHYGRVDVQIEPDTRRATIMVRSPDVDEPSDIAGILAAGDRWWPLAVARELDDAILMLRTNHLNLGTWVLKTAGDPFARFGRRCRVASAKRSLVGA